MQFSAILNLAECDIGICEVIFELHNKKQRFSTLFSKCKLRQENRSPSTFSDSIFPILKTIKAELPQEGILFRTQFPSLGIFNYKKVGFRKN